MEDNKYVLSNIDDKLHDGLVELTEIKETIQETKKALEKISDNAEHFEQLTNIKDELGNIYFDVNSMIDDIDRNFNGIKHELGDIANSLSYVKYFLVASMLVEAVLFFKSCANSFLLKNSKGSDLKNQI